MIVVTITTTFNSTIEEKIQSVIVVVTFAATAAVVFYFFFVPLFSVRVSSIQSFPSFEFVTTVQSKQITLWLARGFYYLLCFFSLFSSFSSSFLLAFHSLTPRTNTKYTHLSYLFITNPLLNELIQRLNRTHTHTHTYTEEEHNDNG